RFRIRPPPRTPAAALFVAAQILRKWACTTPEPDMPAKIISTCRIAARAAPTMMRAHACEASAGCRMPLALCTKCLDFRAFVRHAPRDAHALPWREACADVV